MVEMDKIGGCIIIDAEVLPSIQIVDILTLDMALTEYILENSKIKTNS